MDFFTIPQGNGILAINTFVADDLLPSDSGSYTSNIGFALLPTANDMDILNKDLPFPPSQNIIESNIPFPKPQK